MNLEKLKEPNVLSKSSIKVTNKVSLLSFLNGGELLPFAMRTCCRTCATCAKCNVTRLYIKIPTCVAANATKQVWRLFDTCASECAICFGHSDSMKQLTLSEFAYYSSVDYIIGTIFSAAQEYRDGLDIRSGFINLSSDVDLGKL